MIVIAPTARHDTEDCAPLFGAISRFAEDEDDDEE
jgi:hypothetical protein